MPKRNRFTRFIAALFLVALVFSAFGPLSADVVDPGGGTSPVAPSDTAITAVESTIPSDGGDIATAWYTAAYLLLVLM